MAETYLNLLNSAAAVSANVYDQIDKSMTQRLNVEAQAGKFEVDAMAKAAQFAETQRMNDEQIINMRAGNYLQAQKLEADKLLMPIKLETANLQLEATRLSLQRQKEQEGKNHLNSLTSIYDDQMGYALLETESTAMAQEYLGYKAKVSDHIAKGGKFDSAAFEQGLNTIRSKYVGVKPVEGADMEYSPEKNFLFEQVSPKLGAAYATRHPAMTGSRNSTAVSYYSAESPEQISKLDEKYRRLYTDEEYGKIRIGNDTVQRNEYEIKKESDKARQLRSQIEIARAKNEPEADLVGMVTLLKTTEQEILDRSEENRTLKMNASKGIFGIPEKVQAIATPTGPPATKPNDPSKGVLGVYATPSAIMDPLGAEKFQGMSDVINAVRGTSIDPETGKQIPTPIQQTEFSNVDMSWYHQHGTGEMPTLASRDIIRENVEVGLNKKIGQGKPSQFITEAKVNNLIKLINKDVDIPIDPYLAGSVALNGKYAAGARELSLPDTEYDYKHFGTDQGEPVESLSFGPGSTIKNADDIYKIISNIKDPTEKEETLRGLYAALSAAALATKVMDKSK